MAAQQRLLHDVSHELRSPLARLQAATDLAQQPPHRVVVQAGAGRVVRVAQRERAGAGALHRLHQLGDVDRVAVGLAPRQRQQAAAELLRQVGPAAEGRHRGQQWALQVAAQACDEFGRAVGGDDVLGRDAGESPIARWSTIASSG